MEVIKKLGDRVEKEHDQYLRDSQRIEDRSSTAVNDTSTPNMGGGVDFESLVGGNGSVTVKADTVIDGAQHWDDDVWGSIFNSSDVSYLMACVFVALIIFQSPAISSPPILPPPHNLQQESQSLPSSPRIANPPSNSYSRPTPTPRMSRGMGATPISASSYNASMFTPPPQSRPSLPTQSRSSLATSPPLMPQTSQQTAPSSGYAAQSQSSAPNYNISLSSVPVVSQAASMAPIMPTQPMVPSMASPPLFAASNMTSVLAPSKLSQPSWSTASNHPKQLTKDDWGDFDPLA